MSNYVKLCTRNLSALNLPKRIECLDFQLHNVKTAGADPGGGGGRPGG